MRHTRMLVAATTVALALVGVSACSAAKQATSDAASAAAVLPADAVAALGLANTRIQSETSAKVTGTVQMPGATAPEQITGAMSWGGDAQLVGTVTGAPGIAAISDNGAVSTVVTGGVIYEKISKASAVQQMGGKSWLKIDLGEIAALSNNAAAASAGSSMDSMLKQISPVQTVRTLAADKGVKDEGSETVDGAQATHYSGFVTLAQLLAATPGLDPSQQQNIMKADAKLGLTGETVDIWLNGQALPVRVREHQQTSKGALDIDRHFSDYGVQLSATVPNASDTFDLAAELKALKGSGSA